jgi:hypothetical protein
VADRDDNVDVVELDLAVHFAIALALNRCKICNGSVRVAVRVFPRVVVAVASWPLGAVDSITVIQLIYASTATKAFSAEALRALPTKARAHNTTEDISGMLLHVDGAFFQVLEGEATAVHRLFAKIAGDDRHSKVLLLLERGSPSGTSRTGVWGSSTRPGEARCCPAIATTRGSRISSAIPR